MGEGGARRLFGRALCGRSGSWKLLLQQTKLQPIIYEFQAEAGPGCATHIRLNIFPEDGGVSNLRSGRRTRRLAAARCCDKLNTMDAQEIRRPMCQFLRRSTSTRRHHVAGRSPRQPPCSPRRMRPRPRWARTTSREAFRHHPPIGRRRSGGSRTPRGPPSSRAVVRARRNKLQPARHWPTPIAPITTSSGGTCSCVCATVRPRPSSAVSRRLTNDPETEISRRRRQEQRKITRRLRLERLLG